MQAKMTNANPPSWLCKRNGNDKLWVNPFYLLPGKKKCLFHYLEINYNTTTGEYLDNPGVDVDVVEFGSVNGLSYLEPDIKIPQIGYFEEMIMYLQKNHGYKDKFDMFGAPFDWRLAPDGLEARGYHKKVTKLVENAYTLNNNTKVIFITHRYIYTYYIRNVCISISITLTLYMMMI